MSAATTSDPYRLLREERRYSVESAIVVCFNNHIIKDGAGSDPAQWTVCGLVCQATNSMNLPRTFLFSALVLRFLTKADLIFALEAPSSTSKSASLLSAEVIIAK